MKKFLWVLLCAIFICLTEVCYGQITIQPRPKPIKKTYVVSQTDGCLNYTINNGERKVFRAPDYSNVVDLTTPKFCFLHPQWYPSLPFEEADTTKVVFCLSESNPNDFAKLILQFNKEKKSLMTITGYGPDIVYEYSGGILVGTRNGVLSYIIRNGKREVFKHLEPILYKKPDSSQIGDIHCQQQTLYERSDPDVVNTILPTPDENDFAVLYRQLLRTGWRIVAKTGNNYELVYYFQK